MAATEPAPGAAVGAEGRYRVERLLSTGGMASVWLGRDTRLHRPVALKFLSDVLALDREYVRRFAREARVAAGLTHPHLVGIYDFSGEGGRPFLVMEYIAGGTLGERLRAPGGHGLDAGRLARDLLGALAYIHSAGIIHRDIKPANVLIGADERIRLTDFGIAAPDNATRMTQTGMVLGTARYLAPEVLRGERADARSDLYACGVLLDQLLTRASPPELAALAGRLTQEDPARRPASAQDALDSLAPAATMDAAAATDATTPMAATTPTAATRVRPPRRAGATTARPTRATAARPTGATTARPTGSTPARPDRPAGPATGGRGAPPVTRYGRRTRPRITRTGALLVAGLLVLIGVVTAVAGGGGGGGPTPSHPALPARTAPLSRQLDYLDRAIDAARR